MKYLEVVNSGIEVEVFYCEKHKEYFSNNCSECMLDANDPDTIAKAKADTKSELAKAVREIENPYNPNHQSTEYHTFEIVRMAVLRLLGRKE